MKNIKLQLLLVSFVLFAFVSCNKDDNTEVPDYYSPLEGGWEILQGMDDTEFILFEAENYFYKLNEFGYGFRSVETGIAQATKGQVRIENDNISTLYNYRISHDTLYLSRPNAEIAAVRSDEAPGVTDWMEVMTSSTSFPTPIDYLTDFTFEGSFIWYGNAYSSDYLYRIRTTDGDVDSIPTSQSAWAVEWDGLNLWTSSNGYSRITAVDKTTGINVKSSIDMGPWIYGIASGGGFLWCYSGNENTLYKYDPVADAIMTSLTISSSVQIQGMAYASGHLFICCNGSLARCSLAPFEVVSNYKLEGYYLYGVAFDGANFWVSAEDIQQDSNVILKVNL